MYLGQIAEYIWDNEVGEGVVGTPGFEVGEKQKIADYLEINIGTLNMLINTEFCVDSNATTISPGTGGWTNGGLTKLVYPELKKEESSILIQLYLRDYYKKKARVVLNSSSSSSTTPGVPGQTSDWTELREGDSVIKRVATVATPAQKTAASKVYNSLSQDADDELKSLVQRYNLYLSKPRQVVSQLSHESLPDPPPEQCWDPVTCQDDESSASSSAGSDSSGGDSGGGG
jgi:hypothetical protein